MDPQLLNMHAFLVRKACNVRNFAEHIRKFSEQKCFACRLANNFDCFSVEFDTDRRAVYFLQAEYGMYVRMALLALILGKLPIMERAL